MARQLCFIDVVKRILPIAGADRIEVIQVRNWNTIVKKGSVVIGEKVLFFEPDTLIPSVYDYFNFLDAAGDYWLVSSKTMKGVKSQGLAISLDVANEIFGFEVTGIQALGKALGLDVFDRYNGDFPIGSIGQRPSYIPSLDIERIQNLVELPKGDVYATLKYDGEQRFVYFENGMLRYASKNTLLDLNDDCESNRTLFNNTDIINLAKKYYVACELVGPGIRGNRHNLTEKQLVVIALFAYDGFRFEQSDVRTRCIAANIPTVQTFGYIELPDNLDNIVKLTQELVGDLEGMVVVDKNGFSYKIILDELRV